MAKKRSKNIIMLIKLIQKQKSVEPGPG